MVIMKCTDVFREIFRVGVGVDRGEGGYVGGSFSGGIYQEGRSFPCMGRSTIFYIFFHKRTMGK